MFSENSFRDEALVPLRQLRVAVVHDWLTTYAGSEKVVEQILSLFPQAELFTLVDYLPSEQRGFLANRVIHTSFLQRLPFSARLLRNVPWLFPIAVENFELSRFDLILSSSHAAAKGVITGPDQLHICYCHTPMRYAWDCQHEYLRQAGLDSGLLSLGARFALHYLRQWDVSTAPRVDHFIANSKFVARRIAKTYARTATVIHPPVDVETFPLVARKGNYYVTSSRLVPYKRVDLIIEAFAKMPDRRLLVIGDGPGMRNCRRLAGENVHLLAYQPDDVLRETVSKAKAFVFAAEEDFGISVVEAQASGTPVICFGKGGVLDSVVDGETGIYFAEQTAASIVAAIRKFESAGISQGAAAMRAHAQQFSPEQFRNRFQHFVAARWQEHSAQIYGPPPQPMAESLAMSA